MNGFREITHTADIGLEVWANSYENLFINALNGYYKLVLSADYSSQFLEKYQFTENESNYENLLILFLSEINYLLMVKKLVIYAIDSIKISKNDNDFHLSVMGQINRLKNSEKDIELEIKAVTYHQVKIVETDGIYRTKIFFDI